MTGQRGWLLSGVKHIDLRLQDRVAALFFLSGFAALVYQVVWQRVLFANLGIDSVSIAIIVSVFMLGLSIGAVIGGRIADRFEHLIRWFSGIELAIGVYGALSIACIGAVASMFGSMGYPAMLLASFIALIIPTTLMGMTLPILVIHADRKIGSIGTATGQLYLANTMGAAMGAAVTGFVAFQYLTLSQTVLAAVAINVFVAGCGYLAFRGEAK